MPSYDIEEIDGIPVTLRDGVMFAFLPPISSTSTSTQTPVRLGTYDEKQKKATWEMTPELEAWKTAYRAALAPRARQTASKVQSQ